MRSIYRKSSTRPTTGTIGGKGHENKNYVGIKVSVSLTVPVLPLKFLPNQGFVITRSATMPKEKG